ncbi:MAG: hypothetical protein IJY12_02905 [Clostridia bacterium]|nr:hypothetical protein [Clostridia bacterium]
MGKSKKKVQITKSQNALPPYLIAAIVACTMMVVVVIISSIIIANRPPKIEFIPPEFEANAEIGTPEVPDNLGYAEIHKEGMTFSAWICGEIYQDDGKAIVYFTNPESNDVWLKLRIMDEQGNILGESGLIKPGEYVHSVSLNENIIATTSVRIKIMGYEPETYNSVGSVFVQTEILAENEPN